MVGRRIGLFTSCTAKIAVYLYNCTAMVSISLCRCQQANLIKCCITFTLNFGMKSPQSNLGRLPTTNGQKWLAALVYTYVQNVRSQNHRVNAKRFTNNAQNERFKWIGLFKSDEQRDGKYRGKDENVCALWRSIKSPHYPVSGWACAYIHFISMHNILSVVK